MHPVCRLQENLAQPLAESLQQKYNKANNGISRTCFPSRSIPLGRQRIALLFNILGFYCLWFH